MRLFMPEKSGVITEAPAKPACDPIFRGGGSWSGWENLPGNF